MSKSSLHLALQFSIRLIKRSKPFRNGLISMVVMRQGHCISDGFSKRRRSTSALSAANNSCAM